MNRKFRQLLNYRKKAFIGLGILVAGVVMSPILPFPYSLPIPIAGIVIIWSANNQRKKLEKEKKKD